VSNLEAVSVPSITTSVHSAGWRNLVSDVSPYSNFTVALEGGGDPGVKESQFFIRPKFGEN